MFGCGPQRLEHSNCAMILTGSDEENVPLRLRQPQKKYISYLSIHLDCVVRERLKILRIENDRENIVA